MANTKVGDRSRSDGEDDRRPAVGRLAVGDRIRLHGRRGEVVDLTTLAGNHRQVVVRWLDRPGAPPMSCPEGDLAGAERLPAQA